MNSFDLNELSQEGIIIWCWFFFFFNFCFNIAQVDDDLIASEVHGSVSKNHVELNEFPNDGKIIILLEMK